MKPDFCVVIEGNMIHLQPEKITTPCIVEHVCNRDNGYVPVPHLDEEKYMFHQCVVLGDCDFSNSTKISDNLISPAIVFGVYNIENTNISNLKDAPRFAMKGANIKGTPLAKALGTDYLSGPAYHKLWLVDNNNAMIPELKDELTHPAPSINKINYHEMDVNIYSQAQVQDYDNIRLEAGRGENIVILGNCDLRACKNLISLEHTPLYIAGDLDISGTKVSSLLHSTAPRALKGNLICKDTPLAQRTGMDVITPEIYQKIWAGDNGRGEKIFPYHWRKGLIIREEGRFY